MRRSPRYPVLPALFFALVPACDVSPRGEEAAGTDRMMSATEVDAAVNQVRPQYIQTFGSGARAATGLPALYTPDAVYSDPDGETHAGLAAIRDAFAEGLPPGATLRVSSFGAVGSGDLVVDMGAYTVDLPQANAAPVQENGRYMIAIQRMDDGTWKIVRHLSALSAPGAPAAPDTTSARADTLARDTMRSRDATRTPDTTRIRMDTVPRS